MGGREPRGRGTDPGAAGVVDASCSRRSGVTRRAAASSAGAGNNPLKGEKPRGLLVPAFAVAMLERRGIEVPRGEVDLVFPSARGGLREVTTVEAQWRKFRERHHVALPDIGPDHRSILE